MQNLKDSQRRRKSVKNTEPPGPIAKSTGRKFLSPRRTVFVEDMPRNAMGKILKRRLKEMFRDSLNARKGSA